MGSFHLGTLRTWVGGLVMLLVVGAAAWGQTPVREDGEASYLEAQPVLVEKDPVAVQEPALRTQSIIAAKSTAATVPGSYEQPVVDSKSAASFGDIVTVVVCLIGLSMLISLRNWALRLPFRMLGHLLGR